jgi:hypothetical protein
MQQSLGFMVFPENARAPDWTAVMPYTSAVCCGQRVCVVVLVMVVGTAVDDVDVSCKGSEGFSGYVRRSCSVLTVMTGVTVVD